MEDFQTVAAAIDLVIFLRCDDIQAHSSDRAQAAQRLRSRRDSKNAEVLRLWRHGKTAVVGRESITAVGFGLVGRIRPENPRSRLCRLSRADLQFPARDLRAAPPPAASEPPFFWWEVCGF